MTVKEVDILKTPEGGIIKLADGKEYKLSAMDLTTYADIEAEFDCSMEVLIPKLDERKFTNIRRLLWVLLQEHYPDMTVAQAGRLVPGNNIPGVMKDLIKALGE